MWSFLGAYLRGTGERGIRIPVPYQMVWQAVRLASATVFRRSRKLPHFLVPCRFESRLKPLRYTNESAREVLGWRPIAELRAVSRPHLRYAITIGGGGSAGRSGSGSGARRGSAMSVLPRVGVRTLLVTLLALPSCDASCGGERTPSADAATPSKSKTTHSLTERVTTWSPGIPGGVPAATRVCATVNASRNGNGAADASAIVQAALDACPTGQVVQLSAGTFLINDGHLLINKGVTLRGAGPGVTTLKRTNGATPGSYTPPVAAPIVIIGPNRWPGADDSTSRNLDGRRGQGLALGDRGERQRVRGGPVRSARRGPLRHRLLEELCPTAMVSPRRSRSGRATARCGSGTTPPSRKTIPSPTRRAGSAAGQADQRDQGGRLGQRQRRHLHDAPAHHLPGLAHGTADSLHRAERAREERRPRGPDRLRRRRRQRAFRVRRLQLDAKRREHGLARRGGRDQQLLPRRGARLLHPRRGMAEPGRRRVRDQPRERELGER